MQPNRKVAAAQGQEALNISQSGGYEGPHGTVDLEKQIEAAIRGTVSYPPDAKLPALPTRRFETRVRVANETTLAAARRMQNPVALNFASAKNPGGGFLGGARAQEESLCRSSALFVCIEHDSMYPFHRGRRDAMYTSYAIYSPGVPVFRDDDGALVDPYSVAFITSPAPNAGAVLKKDPSRRSEVEKQMRVRIDKVLRIAAGHGHTSIVLGAWGCGVFKCNLEDTALAFRTALDGTFAGVFEDVVFAVLDFSPERRFIEPFERLLAVPALGR